MDLHFISYPKSGRSWLRYALTHLGVADAIKFHHDTFEYVRKEKPAHDFSIENRFERYQEGVRVVYLSRDPRDVIVSHYFQVTGRFDKIFSYQGDISDFIRDPYFGAENLHKFRQMWDVLIEKGIAINVTYEDCHKDFARVLQEITTYYGLLVRDENIVEAQDAASFDNMKKVERSETFPKNWLKPKNGAYKVRRGVVGGFHDYLSDKDIEYLNSLFKLEY